MFEMKHRTLHRTFIECVTVGNDQIKNCHNC